MEGFVREAMDAGALGMSTGLEFNPGREATTAELVRLNAVAGEYDGIYTSHVRNRDAGILDAIDEFLEVARAGGTRAEISHLNVRHNTGAPDRGWERAVELMAAAREEGMDVLADTTPFRRRPRPARRDPAAVGRGRRAGGGARAPARPRDPAAAPHRVRPLLALRPQGRVGSRAPPGERRSTPSGTASRSRRSPTCRKADPWDCFFDVLADAGAAYESVLVVGTLFTDEHLAEMISHPLFCLGVDTFTVTREGPLADVLRHPLGLRGARPLPHAPRPRERHAAPRGGDPEDDEHAGGALRPLGPGPAPGRLRGRRGRLRLRRARRRLDDRRSAPLRARRRARARQRRRIVVDGGEHTGARPGGTCSAR